MKFTLRGAVAVAAVNAFALSACTAPADESDNSNAIGGVSATWAAVDISAVNGETVLEVHRDSLPELADVPSLVAGSFSEDGEPARAAIWDGDTFQSGVPALLDVDGETSMVTDLEFHDGTTYALGNTVTQGRGMPFLHSSTDRVSWSAVTLPETIAAGPAHFTELAVHPDLGVVLAGTDLDGAVAIASLETGEVSVVTGLEGTSLVALDVVRGAVVVLGQQEAGAKAGRVRAVRSTDLTTWSKPVDVAPTGAVINGAASNGTTMVVTGSREASAGTLATAWSSTQGRTWKREDVYVEAFPTDRGVAGAPVIDDEGKFVVGTTHQRSVWGQIYTRTRKGSWSLNGWLDEPAAPGAVPMVVPEKLGVVTARQMYGAVEVGRMIGETWTGRYKRGEATRLNDLEAVQMAGERHLVSSRMVVEHGEGEERGHWRRYSQAHLSVAEGSSAVAAEWPVEAWNEARAMFASGTDGTTIAVTDNWITRDDKSDVQVWRTAADSPGSWEQVGRKALALGLAEQATTVARIGDEWFVAGAQAATFDNRAPVAAVVWASADTRAWKVESAPRPGIDGSHEWINAMCALPADGVLAVGTHGGDRNTYEPLAIRRVAGKWSRGGIATPAGVTSLTACAGDASTALVTGTTDDDSVLLRTSNGKEFTTVELPGKVNDLASVVSVPGGFAVLGAVGEGPESRSVLWVSTDGQKWQSIDVPMQGDASPSSISFHDGVLTVVTHETTGYVVHELTNVAELVAASGKN